MAGSKKSDKLGEMVEVPITEGWGHEASDFTPWLSEEKNLNKLAKAIGLELEYVNKENTVEGGRIDILCKESSDIENEDEQAWVIIENQIRNSDFEHLGKLIAYAAGLSARTFVWVAPKFEEKHKSSLDWLNKNTKEDFRFFGVEIHLYRIGDSALAPQFNVVSKPSDWERSGSKVLKKIGDEGSALRREYWEKFKIYLQQKESILIFSVTEAYHQNFKKWLDGSIVLQSWISEKKICLSIYIKADDIITTRKIYTLLENNQDEIINQIDEVVNFEEQETITWEMHKKGGSISLKKNEKPEIENSNKMNQQFDWLSKNLKGFHDVFNKYIEEIDINDLPDIPDENESEDDDSDGEQD